MKFFQCIGFGDSTSFCGGKMLGIIWCGIGQGSKGAPASWLQMSSSIVNAYKAMDYGAAMMDPVTRLLIVLRKKMESWCIKMTNGHLSSSLAWLSYMRQLWPGLRYGLGVLTNDPDEADTLLDKCDFIILSILGVCRNIKMGRRRLHQTFGGVGLLHIPTKQLICKINMFLHHYHTSSTLRKIPTHHCDGYSSNWAL